MDIRAERNAPERVNWWLRLTSSGWESRATSLKQREAARRSRLASWIILGLLAADALIIPVGFGEVATLIAIATVALGILLAAALNRAGHVNGAGVLIVLVLAGGVMGSLLSETQGLTLDSLPGYDLLAIGVIVAASVLPAASAFVVAAFNSTIICLDFFLQKPANDLTADIQSIGSNLQGSLALIARPIALQLIIAVVAYLWARGIENAIRRADRAEEIATLEHSIAEQKRQLDIGIQQILQTHIRAANGDFTARAPLGQENILWQIAASLNNLLARLQRAGQAEHQLRRTEEELARLAAAIDDAQSGRRPIWPAPSGTAADLVITRISRAASPPGEGLPPVGPAQASAPRPGQYQQPADPWSAGPPSAWPPANPAGASMPVGGVDGWPTQSDVPLPPLGATSVDPSPGRETANPWAFPPESDESDPWRGR
jgi:hypothetical protein